VVEIVKEEKEERIDVDSDEEVVVSESDSGQSLSRLEEEGKAVEVAKLQETPSKAEKKIESSGRLCRLSSILLTQFLSPQVSNLFPGECEPTEPT
jgi:hypothetical protein